MKKEKERQRPAWLFCSNNCDLIFLMFDFVVYNFFVLFLEAQITTDKCCTCFHCAVTSMTIICILYAT